MGDFIVGRYEAGLASSISEFTEIQVDNGSNQIYNKEGIPQSKAGQIPWMFIDREHAKESAESMYKTNYVSSGLITGTQWDVMLKKMIQYTDLEENDIVTSSEKWGNYRSTPTEYKGRKAVANVNSSGLWYLSKFGDLEEGNTSANNQFGVILTTGASKVTEKYHIYDVAGNLYEWTEENSTYKTDNQFRIKRGGTALYANGLVPACYRNGITKADTTLIDTGFRTVLYLK